MLFASFAYEASWNALLFRYRTVTGNRNDFTLDRAHVISPGSSMRHARSTADVDENY